MLVKMTLICPCGISDGDDSVERIELNIFFDFSTKEGFLRDLNTYEKAMIKARDQVMKDITDEYLESGVKKTVKKEKSTK